jgi:hypothetical protein
LFFRNQTNTDESSRPYDHRRLGRDDDNHTTIQRAASPFPLTEYPLFVNKKGIIVLVILYFDGCLVVVVVDHQDRQAKAQ